jgi:hypothetical protein
VSAYCLGHGSLEQPKSASVGIAAVDEEYGTYNDAMSAPQIFFTIIKPSSEFGVETPQMQDLSQSGTQCARIEGEILFSSRDKSHSALDEGMPQNGSAVQTKSLNWR